ncbi:hypothetical protein G6011_05546 [Alternaria panax]|uniref:Telomere replication protein EST3 n=1 Tax=Alternaria panax TaxID=48097 RepID=A0AAD4FCU0_9PLEO|nr:hypothetical protein G6011_05546 [Alternaria panax]
MTRCIQLAGYATCAAGDDAQPPRDSATGPLAPPPPPASAWVGAASDEMQPPCKVAQKASLLGASGTPAAAAAAAPLHTYTCAMRSPLLRLRLVVVPRLHASRWGQTRRVSHSRLELPLEDTFESQLLLGNQWLQDRHEKKKSRARPETAKLWSAYHDNGSSLDTLNYVHPKRNCALRLSPLTLTDGQSQIISSFTPDCARDFFQRHPAVPHLTTGATIAARKYTVRFTSYGPPPERLRLVLDRIDWLGESCERLQLQGSATPTSLHACKQIAHLLEQLRGIRELEDRRCLASDGADTEAEDDAGADAMRLNDNMPDGNDPHSLMQDTQLPFGTQIAQPSRPHTSENEPQFLGLNRLEPVMAGNTQRTEIRPGAANSDYGKQTYLLTLLTDGKTPSASIGATASAPGFAQSAFSKPQSAAAPTTHESPRPPSDSLHEQSTLPEAEAESGEVLTSMPNHGKKRTKEGRDFSPEDTNAAEDSRVEEHDIQQILIEDSSSRRPECPWMKGFVFDSETLKVPRKQAEVLGRNTSWLKPQVGVQPFQDGNMPASILKNIHLMADERAGTDNDEDADINSSPESPDPSPESLPHKTQDKEPANIQDGDSTASQMSWEVSPEPPAQPARPPQGLPPDSSNEKQASHSEHESASQPGSKGQQPSQPPVINISDDEDPVSPPSSPPVPAAPTGSDEEMDMEESVPQALGEDLVQRTQPSSASDKLPDAVLVRSPVVQVKETPYGKGQHASAPRNAQKPSRESKPTSSASIVHSTYDRPSASDLTDLGIFETTKQYPSDTQERTIDAERKEVEVFHDKAKYADTDEIGHVEIQDVPDAEDFNKQIARGIVATQPPPNDLDSESMPPPTSHAIPHSMRLHPKNGRSEASPTVPHLASQSTKRKLVALPTKSNRRQFKRRGIKIVGFGDDSPSDVDLLDSLRKDREESLRRYLEQRNSSTTSFESRSEPTSKPTDEHDPDAMNIDGVEETMKKEPSPSMSPRHQGLYDEPSPRRAQSAANPASQPPKTHPPSRTRLHDTHARGQVPIPAQPLLISSENVDEGNNMTVFQSFKAAYPEYNGNEKHFENQCNQMYQLELEDKMVPKWQWDDFIIRNRTDYSQYAMDCINQGEDPEPYYRFYKDNIRGTLYNSGIIQNTKILQRALEELCRAPAKTNKSRQPPRPIQELTPTRRSLLGAFKQPKKPTHRGANGTSSRPRHSLPTNARIRPESPLGPTSSAISLRSKPRHSNSMTRISSASRSTDRGRTHLSLSDTPAETLETFDDQGSTGDRYKDFYFGYQRITSLTGSPTVSSMPTRSDKNANKSFEKGSG